MAWQQSDLDAIEKAIASGALTVKFSDKEVTYRAIGDMMQVRDAIKRAIGSVKRSKQRLYSHFNKGLRIPYGNNPNVNDPDYDCD